MSLIRDSFLRSSSIAVGLILVGSIGCELPAPEGREPGRGAVQRDGAPSSATARELLSSLAAGDYITAANAFHYPPSYSAKERSTDVALVSASLEVLLRRLGPIRHFEDGFAEEPIAHLGVGGGTGEYWQRCSASALLPFRVEFERLPQGVALVRMCRIGGDWEVQALHLGGRVTSPDVRAMLASTGQEMAALFQQE